MYCFVRFQNALRSVFDESSQTAWLFCTTSNIYRYIPTNSHKILTNYIPVFSGRITLYIGENSMEIRAVVFEFFVSRQADRQTRRRTSFYNMYRQIDIEHLPCLLAFRCWPRPDLRPTSLSYNDILCWRGWPGGPGGPASGLEYTELWRPLPKRPEEYVVLEERTEPMRFSCRWNQFFRLSTSGVSTLSCDYKQHQDYVTLPSIHSS